MQNTNDLKLTDQLERELIEHLRRNTKILDTLRSTNVLDDATEADLEKEIDTFITSFQGGKGGTKAGSEQFDALPADEVEQATIVKPRKRK
jgi:F-type H+-transporting ATPase subunit alpha